MDVFRLRRQQVIGDQAQSLLKNELLTKWWDSVEANLFRNFKEIPIEDKEALRDAKAMIDAVQSMRNDFQRYITTGKHAAETLKEIKKPTGLRKMFNG